MGGRTGREDAEEEEGAASRSGISRARLQDVLPRGGGLYDRGPLQLQQRIDISGDADMPVVEHGATIISYRHSNDLTRRRCRCEACASTSRPRQLNLSRPDPTLKPAGLFFDALYRSLR